MNICVYLGANEGNNPIYKEGIKELGTWIGKNNHTLVYGGSKVGLMGILADSALDVGGKVIGVEPEFFVSACKQNDNLTKLIVTKDIRERKGKMIELSDAFIAFPGGTGTLEEIAEIISMVCLNQTDSPCIIYNLNHYYDEFKLFLDKMIQEGFSTKEKLKNVLFVENIDQIKEILSK